MSKIVRKIAKLFGNTAGANQIAKFGSLAASAAVTYSGATADPATLQSLGNWNGGWNDAVIGPSSPAIEDMNAFSYVVAYQLAYLMQTGVPEWDATTTYYIGSLVTSPATGTMYVSRTDTNLNNALPGGAINTNWQLYADVIGTVMTATGANPIANARTRAVTTNGTDPGVGGVCMSTSSGAFSSATSSFTTISALDVTLTTSGRPVFIGLIPDPAAAAGSTTSFVGISCSTGAAFCYLKFLRGTSSLGVMELNDANNTADTTALNVPPGQIYVIDTPAAGTYTWHLQFENQNSTLLSVNYSLACAYEL